MASSVYLLFIMFHNPKPFVVIEFATKMTPKRGVKHCCKKMKKHVNFVCAGFVGWKSCGFFGGPDRFSLCFAAGAVLRHSG